MIGNGMPEIPDGTGIPHDPTRLLDHARRPFLHGIDQFAVSVVPVHAHTVCVARRNVVDRCRPHLAHGNREI